MSGPSVYRGMDQAELDRQYDARGTVEDIQPFLDAYAAGSARARDALDVRRNIPYGASAEELFDFFPAGQNAPVFVFIHGGYWRLLSKNESSFFAEAMVQRSIAVAAVNYALAPAVSLDEIVRQVRAAIRHIWREAALLGIDRDRIFVGGSSAGAHLAGMLLSDQWQAQAGLPDDVVAGAVLASGLYDLEPVRLCKPNEWIKLDAASARRNSPIHHLPKNGCPVLVTWGGSETEEFKRQSADYARAWSQLPAPVTSFEVSDRNHFDIVLDLANPSRELAQQVVAMIERS